MIGYVVDSCISGGILDIDGVTALCVESCYTSLQNARTTIKGACTAITNIIVYQNIAYSGNELRYHVAIQFIWSY